MWREGGVCGTVSYCDRFLFFSFLFFLHSLFFLPFFIDISLTNLCADSSASDSINDWTLMQFREILETYANTRNMNPLRPDTWYNTTLTEIQQDEVCLFLISIFCIALPLDF